MEDLTRKFNKEVKKKKDNIIRSISSWEDSPSDLQTIALNYKGIEEIIASCGIDLKKVKVLELGSGNTAFLDHMRKQGVDAVGVDVLPGGKSHHK